MMSARKAKLGLKHLPKLAKETYLSKHSSHNEVRYSFLLTRKAVEVIGSSSRRKGEICMQNTKNFRSMDCDGCQCKDCYECASANCEICYRAEFANESDKDMYRMIEDIKNCDFR